MLEVIIVVGVIIIKTIISVIVLKGDDGVVIIDTLESCEVAKEVREAFEEVKWNRLLKFCYRRMNEYGQSWFCKKTNKTKSKYWNLGDEKASCWDHSDSLSRGSRVWDCWWVKWRKKEHNENKRLENKLKNVFFSEFLRGREEGEVEIFAHDSFPTYFRQVTLRQMPV